MKKKILAIAIVAIMIIIAIASVSLAYLQDTDYDKNVMTVGNVKIVQNETDRYNNAYEDGKKLLPAVYVGTPEYDKAYVIADGLKWPLWDETVNNELDKIITVTNTGTESAYIRTIVLMENTEDNAVCGKIHGLWGGNDGQYREWITNDNGGKVTVKINDVLYSVAVCTYETALAPGKTSSPSLMQIYLDPSANNSWYDLVTDDQGNAEFNILALSQAVQSAGFEELGSEAALNAAFGEVTAANVYEWFIGASSKSTGSDNTVPTKQ